MKKRRGRWIGIVMTGVLLVAQSVLWVSRYANATQPGAVVINELSTQPGWVELYNPTETSVELTHWRLQSKSQSQTVNGTIVSHGFFVVDIALGVSSDTIQLFDEGATLISTVAYGGGDLLAAPETFQSLARRADGSTVWALGAPTKGFSNKTDFLPPSVPSGGAPNDTVETTLDFAFSWQPATDSDGPVSYEFRMASSPELLGLGFSSGVDGTNIAFRNNIDAGDGEWYWQVRAVDQSQNYSDWSAVWHVRVDTNGPGITIEQPSIAGLFGGPLSKDIPFQASIIGARGESPFTLELDGADITQKVSSSRDDKGSWRITGSFMADGLNEGSHIFRLRATDDVGNPGEQLTAFVTDTTAPKLSTNMSEGARIGGKVRVTLAAQEAHPGKYGLDIEHDKKPISMNTTNSNDVMDEAESGSSVFSYLWDTTTVEDGTYELHFNGVDAVGNKAFLTRKIIVSNTPGSGSLTTSSSQKTDPLLDQLSKQLTQAFVTRKSLSLPSVEVVNMSDQLGHARRSTLIRPPATDQNAKITVFIPSENGWRIFGVLWYWWLLLCVVAPVIVYRYRKVNRAAIISIV